MIVLRSKELLALVDPAHGAEILELVHLPTGRRLLGRPPFSTEPPVPGDLPEDVWTASYRGGWQLAAPNAGASCRVGDVEHGFHGRASNDPWEVLASEPSTATLRVARPRALVRAHVRAHRFRGAWPVCTLRRSSRPRSSSSSTSRSAWSSSSPRSRSIFPPGWPTSSARRTGHRSRRPTAPRWPDVLLLDGSQERGDRWPLDRPRSRLLAVAELPEGRARVRNARTGTTVELSWDASWLRHLWIWHETREYGGPWRGQAELLAIEPTSVPHPLGLAAAIEHGQALQLGPGETAGYELRLAVSVA